MPLITRLSRLFRADFHAVLDQIEEPDALLRQAVREMEDALEQDEQRLQLLRHEQAQHHHRHDELTSTSTELEEQLDICFSAGKDELAKGLIRRRLENLSSLKQLTKRQQQLQHETDKLQQKIADNRRQLDTMRQKVELLVRAPVAEAFESSWPKDEISVRDEEVEVAFLREKQRRAQS